MKISRTGTRATGRLLLLPILAGTMLATIGAQPALAQRDEQRFQEERHDERRIPPGHAKRYYRPAPYYGYYETPRYVYAPPPVVYAPPSAFEFVFPLTFR